eukprot:s4364_g1.t1
MGQAPASLGCENSSMACVGGVFEGGAEGAKQVVAAETLVARLRIAGKQEGEELYGQSKPVEALGAFLSHNWDADGSSKVVALTLQTSWPLLLACWLLVACVFFTLGLVEILPMPFINGSREDRDPLSCWILGTSWTSSFLSLLILATSILGICLGIWLSTVLPGSSAVFMDMACVHQSNPQLRRGRIDVVWDDSKR